jgi:hypothetical protein
MKLNIVAPRTGFVWVRQGIRTFWKQPLAMSGLFFLFMAWVSVASMVPVVGNVLALVLLPAMTLGLMAATAVAEQGKFPMPGILLVAFRSGQAGVKDMLVLGGLYAFGFIAVMGISTLVDGGLFAGVYLMGAPITAEKVNNPAFQNAMWLAMAMALYLPLSMMFWHAPALLHWHGVPPVKSLFFSLVACWRNLGAFMVYTLAWLGVFLSAGMVVLFVVSLIGEQSLAENILTPIALLMAAMFFTSVYFSVLDCFGEMERTDSPSA